MRKLLGRDDHLGDKLVAPDGGDLGLDDEIIHLHPPLTVHALQHHLRVQQDQWLRHITLGGSVADVAADGGTVAQGHSSHAGSGILQQRMGHR